LAEEPAKDVISSSMLLRIVVASLKLDNQLSALVVCCPCYVGGRYLSAFRFFL
jgi:hypothetical protein